MNNKKLLIANHRKWNNLTSYNISAGQKLIVGYLVSPEQIASQNTVSPPDKEYAKIPEEKTDVVKKDDEKPVQKPETVVEKKIEKPKTTNQTVSDGNGGYFKAAFEAQIKVQPVRKDDMAAAGIFKTASGWQDAKYYALIDGVEPGTIVKIINPNNNKVVYAKVLDKMTGIRQNQGYDIRISNAAATALDITDSEKFFVRVNY